jgi:CheY-like chemotaxis protein
MMMPVMNGWEFCKKITDKREFCDIPVIILSAVSSLAEQACETNAKAVVPKPFRADQLLDLVARFARADAA